MVLAHMKNRTQTVCVKASPSIALIKYWGKKQGKMNENGAPFGQKAILGEKEHFGAQNRFWAQKVNLGLILDFGPKKPFIYENCEKVNDGLASRKENRDSRIRARTASTGARGSENM